LRKKVHRKSLDRLVVISFAEHGHEKFFAYLAKWISTENAWSK